MKRQSLPFDFSNGRGQVLAGTLDRPLETPRFFGVFAPCFTCTKESHGAAKICRALAEDGVAMLRFDITGLGRSEGDFAEQNFSTRILDIIAACQAVEAAFEAPKLLVGHSMGGTASLSAAKHLPLLRVVATLGSPADPAYTADKFEETGAITHKGERIEIDVLGRPTLFRPDFIDNLRAQNTAEDTAALTQKLLIFHAPHDDIVSFKNAEIMKQRAGDKARLIPLDPAATHLFERRGDDAVFVAKTLLERVE